MAEDRTPRSTGPSEPIANSSDWVAPRKTPHARRRHHRDHEPDRRRRAVSLTDRPERNEHEVTTKLI